MELAKRREEERSGKSSQPEIGRCGVCLRQPYAQLKLKKTVTKEDELERLAKPQVPALSGIVRGLMLQQ